MQVFQPVQRLAHTMRGFASGKRDIAEETAIALTYDGTTYAVMMASPADLEDFGIGFSLTERVIGAVSEIEDLTIVEHGGGIEVQMRLTGDVGRDLTARRRQMAGPVGCGLCGIDSIEQALRAPVMVPQTGLALSAAEVTAAVGALSRGQVLNARTRAVHAAGFYRRDGGALLVREDVGRHNALDKLIGALARAGLSGPDGALVMTSRVSVEIVQKAAASGCGFILAVSAPTALAVRLAEQAGITLVAIVRGEDFEVFTHPDRIKVEEVSNVA